MATAPRDQNDVPTLLGVSNSDGTTPVVIYADPTTHRLLVDNTGTVGGVVYYTPTGTVNASNTAFTVTAEPTSVVSDGVVYFANNGYTYAALTITLDVPPSQYIRYTL